MEQTTKNKIRLVAARLFADNGYDGTSIRKIAEEAEVNSAMIAYYFNSKEGLLEEILDFFSKRLMSYADLIKPEQEPREQIHNAINFLISAVIDHHHIVQIRTKDNSIHRNLKMKQRVMLEDKKLFKYLTDLFQKANPKINIFNIGLLIMGIKAIVMNFACNQDFIASLVNLEMLDLSNDKSKEQLKKLLQKKMSGVIDNMLSV